PENINSKVRVCAVQLLVERADKDDTPEAFDGSLCLFMFLQPGQHGDRLNCEGVLEFATSKQYGRQGAGDGKLVGEGKRREREKRPGHVKWRWENSVLHHAGAALRVQKKQTVEELDFPGRPDAAVKILEISAAAERHVLAIVHVLAIRQHVRGRAASK